MKYVYSDKDQKSIDEAKHSIKEYETHLFKRLDATTSLNPNKNIPLLNRLFVEDEVRLNMRLNLVKLIETRIPVGLEL